MKACLEHANKTQQPLSPHSIFPCCIEGDNGEPMDKDGPNEEHAPSLLHLERKNEIVKLDVSTGVQPKSKS